MERAAYSATMDTFLAETADAVLGKLVARSAFDVQLSQREAWQFEIEHMQRVLAGFDNRQGTVYFEFEIPRMGRRVDVVLLLGGVVFVLEYKVGSTDFAREARDQVVDYALDLKNFHETSHDALVVPVLIATEAGSASPWEALMQDDRVMTCISTNAAGLDAVLRGVLSRYPDEVLSGYGWYAGRYQPTPTIIEAATALYAGHDVENLSRSDAGAANLTQTSRRIEQVIAASEAGKRKAICFVTGVPGAGKTLVGLNIATEHFDPDSDLYSVFLSGNGPLVKVLHEALARDRVARACKEGRKVRKGDARSKVKAFIQNVHHFRDDALRDNTPPIEHVALFDEAQRAWDHATTADFMRRKKRVPDFSWSEPAFLVSCMDRHSDWAVIVCLVGGGQEINKGESGIGEWLAAIRDRFPAWEVFAAPDLTDSEYRADGILRQLDGEGRVTYCPEPHLAVSMRSFRAEQVSNWVKALLDGDLDDARRMYKSFHARYPVVLTRSFDEAKAWTRQKARGNERYGLMVSSQAYRLKPYAVDVRHQINPVHWFLNGKADVRSSYYLEDVATEFHVQGLELDWGCVAWDADLRRTDDAWDHYSFRGNRWQRIRKLDRQRYQLNAYRVLLTRARQGMAIVVPQGDRNDPTRDPSFYDPLFTYLRDAGVECL